MNYRKYEILAAEDITTPTTRPIDLKGLNPISRINIQTLQTHATSELMTGHVAEIVTRVQIVDGSTPLFDATGFCVQAQDWYQGRLTPLNTFYDHLKGYSRCNFTINFGRFLFDPILGFDPSKFKNPQLKITHDKTASGDSAPSAQTLRVALDLFDEKVPALIGFLQFKEVFSKAIAASNSEYIDLPVDMAYRSLMLQSLYASRRPTFLFESIKLDEDNGKRIVLEDSMEEMLPNLSTYRLFTERMQLLTAAGLKNYFCTPAQDAQLTGCIKNADDSIYFQPNDGGRIQLGCGGAAQQAIITVTGYCPHGAISIPFGDPMDIEDWYDVNRVEKLSLRLNSSQYATNGQDQVVMVEQLRKY